MPSSTIPGPQRAHHSPGWVSSRLGRSRETDDLFPLQPPADAKLVTSVVAHENEELPVETLPVLTLPPEGEIRRADDEHTLDQTAEIEFTNQYPGHDRPARAGIGGEKRSLVGQFEKMLVDSFELLRQWTHTRDRKSASV